MGLKYDTDIYAKKKFSRRFLKLIIIFFPSSNDKLLC